MKSGLGLMYSQVNLQDKDFLCGEIVPNQPESLTVYGVTQEFISN